MNPNGEKIYYFTKKKDLAKKSEDLIKLLEYNGEEYYNELCNLRNNYNNDEIKEILNETHYICYMGHHLHALIYLVGDLVNEVKEGVYGTNYSISEDLGNKILEEFIKYDIDFDLKNYYKEKPLENLNSVNTLTYRKNNNNFKKKLKDYYISRLNSILMNQIN